MDLTLLSLIIKVFDFEFEFSNEHERSKQLTDHFFTSNTNSVMRTLQGQMQVIIFRTASNFNRFQLTFWYKQEFSQNNKDTMNRYVLTNKLSAYRR